MKQIFIWTILLIFAVIACEELPCDDTDGINIEIGFYSYDGTTLKDTSINSLVVILGNTPENRYSDTLSSKTQYIKFPLSITDDSSTVILNYGKSASDTLVIHHIKTLALKSYPCGFDNFFEITSINATNNRLDSVYIREKSVEYHNIVEKETENVKIYF